jgi:hypothetical protein
LVTVVEQDAKNLLDGVFSQKNMDAIKTELGKFTAYLSSGEAQKDIKKFAGSLGDLADVIHKIAHPLDSVAKPAGDWIKTTFGPLDKWIDEHLRTPVSNGQALRDFGKGPLSMPGIGSPPGSGKASLKQYANAQDAINGLPAGSTWAAIQVEDASLNPRAKSGKGAIGLMQLLPGTAKDLGVTDPFNPQQNIQGGSKYLAQQLALGKKMFPHGSLQEQMAAAGAAYNMGPGAFKKFMAREESHHRGAMWMADLNSESDQSVQG